MQIHPRKIRVAFIKFAGLSAGGTERWLQTMAANLPKNRFEVDYYYCDAADYIGSSYKHADTDNSRVQYMLEHDVNLIKFRVGAKDVTTPTHDWLDSDFLQIFDSNKYDFVQTAKAGPAEYPYFLLPLPIVEYVSLDAGVDRSPNIIHSIHISEWQRRRWFARGGNLANSSVIPVPASPPSTTDNLRQSLGIPAGAIVAGFHQRADNDIYSPIPLRAFKKIVNPNRHFVIMGGGTMYRKQAKELELSNVHFIAHKGDSQEVSKFLNTLDIFAHGRRDGETFGTVFAEAMMHGIPCISHRSEIANAMPETMGPGGEFAQNEEDYTFKLANLFVDEILRGKLADLGRNHARKYYTTQTCVERLVNVYECIMTNPQKTVKPLPHLMSYGMVDMGFLYSGNVSEPADISYCVLTGGCPEEFCIHLLRYFLPRINVMFDIGANTGLYCWIVAHEGLQSSVVHVYEPQSELCKIMAETVSLNRWGSRVSIHQKALGSKYEHLDLHLSGTGSSLDNEFNDNADLPIESVTVDKLDNEVDRLQVKKVDFIKIDVEGFEYEVLLGARDTITRDQPILFIEIADQVIGRKYRNKNYKKTLIMLQSLGYVILRADDKMASIKKIDPESDQGYHHLAMYLCIPSGAWSQLRFNIYTYVEIYRWQKLWVRLKHLYSRATSCVARHLTPKTIKNIFK